ncbi:NACHT domain-containing protein [Mycena venus]|uniref:NACHT domain-containing protein n=1 Tax=Mycena venus TaxID=2733690 RepID=A0A8H7CSQ0_9AGAR|nr:NACHT domain-containing protein [Mycena venus]
MSVPSFQDPALGYPLNWAGYAASSYTPNEPSHCASNYPSAHLDPSQPHQYPVKKNAGFDRNLDAKAIFPWNHPQNTPATSINGGTFISGNVNNIQRHGEAAGDAFHDSAERYPQPRCHPGTRTKLLDVLWNWTRGIEPPRNWTSYNDSENDEYYEPASVSDEQTGASSTVLWLHGPAGSGKSAVAQSLCQKLEEEGRLGGSFFFKRGHPSRGSANKLFPTIAYQLSLHREFGQFISQTLEKDPAVVNRSLSSQLHALIIEPCRKASLSQPMPIVIDGLDECDGHDIQQEILESIGNAVSRERLPLLFFIVCRPESHICETFAGSHLDGVHRPLNIVQSFDDVRRYLADEFSRIHREHRTMTTVPTPWPSSEMVDALVEKSSGYFIYASTVIKFIDDKRFRPVERLDIIKGIKQSVYGSPFSTLDQLYHQILCGVPQEFRSQLLGILTTLHAQFFLCDFEIDRLLELQTGDVRLILRELHSVIDLEHDYLRVHHASLLDFLDNPLRSGPFYVGSSQCCTDLAYHLLKAFTYRHDGPSQIRKYYLEWKLSQTAYKYITLAEPAPDLLPLVQAQNPDFFFGGRSFSESTFLDWLKKFRQPPKGLVDLWEDYTFMMLCDQAWTQTESAKESHSNNCHDIVSRMSSQLIKILYYSRVIPFFDTPGILFRIHFLLDLSWDELRAVICPLRRILRDDTEHLHELRICSEETLQSLDSNSLLSDLSDGAFRVLGTMFNGEMDWDHLDPHPHHDPEQRPRGQTSERIIPRLAISALEIGPAKLHAGGKLGPAAVRAQISLMERAAVEWWHRLSVGAMTIPSVSSLPRAVRAVRGKSIDRGQAPGASVRSLALLQYVARRMEEIHPRKGTSIAHRGPSPHRRCFPEHDMHGVQSRGPPGHRRWWVICFGYGTGHRRAETKRMRRID